MVQANKKNQNYRVLEELYRINNGEEAANKYQQTMKAGDKSRLELALDLADREYHHPESELVNALVEQRSFCFNHGKVTNIAVLLIHGWTACPFEMRELGDYLFKKGLNVFGVRLAGHGTKVEDFAKYGQKEWVESTQKGLVIASLLGQKVIVVGESMGGALAAILAASFPGMIYKIILCAPCLKTKDWKAEFSTCWLIKKLIPTVDMGLQYDWQKDFWYGRIPINGVAELIKIAREARNLGNHITTPTLIIQASNDQLVKPGAAKKFFKTLTQLNGNDKRLQFFDNGHHNLTVDLNPRKKDVFRWIMKFIN